MEIRGSVKNLHLWGAELLGVITSLAPRKTAGFDAPALHHLKYFEEKFFWTMQVNSLPLKII